MSFNLKLVTPEAVLYKAEAFMVVVPGEQGDFGVMSLHTSLMSALRPGLIQIYSKSEQQIDKTIFIKDGFAEVNHESCTILAETATDVTGNPELAAKLLQEAEITAR